MFLIYSKILVKKIINSGVNVNSVKIMKEKLTGTQLGKNFKLIIGYCFVEFSTFEEAKNILQGLNGKLMPGTSR